MHTISEDDLIYLYESGMIDWADYCKLITQIAEREDALHEMTKINQESGQYKKEMLDSMGECIVKRPHHYQLFPEYNLEIKDVNKRILDRIQESGFDMTLYEAGWWMQSKQYFDRFYLKNGLEDLKKGVETMQFVIDSMESRK